MASLIEGPRGVCILCGLPGAGKSTLSKKLLNYSFSQSSPSVVVSIVEYDKYLDGAESDSYKMKRAAALGNIEHTITSNKDTALPWIVLADDNMHLVGMRHELYQLCRAEGIGFCILHVQTPVWQCLDALKSRPNNEISPDIVENMANKFESPDSEYRYWEANVVSVRNPFITCDVSLVWTAMTKHLLTPVPPLVTAEQTQQKELAAEETKESILHQCDICLRKQISIYSASLQSNRDTWLPFLATRKKLCLSIIKTELNRESKSLEDWKLHCNNLFGEELRKSKFPLAIC